MDKPLWSNGSQQITEGACRTAAFIDKYDLFYRYLAIISGFSEDKKTLTTECVNIVMIP